MGRRVFSREFKLEAVKLVRERGVTIAQAARDLEVHENVLRKWIKDVAGDPAHAFPGHGQMKPEHLEIETRDPDRLAGKIRNAGAIFLGQHTPEAIGDYVAGSNHVLPTARSARFSSGLGVLDFMKRTSILRLDAEALLALGPAAIALGKGEGLEAHARSVAIRLNR